MKFVLLSLLFLSVAVLLVFDAPNHRTRQCGHKTKDSPCTNPSQCDYKKSKCCPGFFCGKNRKCAESYCILIGPKKQEGECSRDADCCKNPKVPGTKVICRFGKCCVDNGEACINDPNDLEKLNIECCYGCNYANVCYDQSG